MQASVPATLDELREQITLRYDSLSKRLKQIGRFVLDYPNDVALETVVVIAERSAVQPSALIRFAQAFGYSGFSDMQRVFQAALMHGNANYRERIRLSREGEQDIDADQPLSVLRAFAGADMAALEQLPLTVDGQVFAQAVEFLAKAPGILLAGQRRAFPVAAYLAYALSHLDRPVRLLDGLGGMLKEQVRSAGRQDVLVAISFSPYAPETREVVDLARQRGLRVIALTDSPLSPLVQQADVWFDVRDAEVQGFRTLNATLCLAQSLAVAAGYRLEQELFASPAAAGQS
ncbi:MurR/RpiR family transcriptional regulator [Pseudomonas paeninsulae]|uniref:MurR/RpiR family transcriptional regulator n=1 Tax=Pseudomonas paeninsulae TaxID=3110772 RepID=UPI002D798954|nr:MurR/RpiR family transcriptional regulator [Pseudomonas sp. IT1137]